MRRKLGKNVGPSSHALVLMKLPIHLTRLLSWATLSFLAPTFLSASSMTIPGDPLTGRGNVNRSVLPYGELFSNAAPASPVDDTARGIPAVPLRFLGACDERVRRELCALIAEWGNLLHLQRWRRMGVVWGSERDQQDRTLLSRNVFGRKWVEHFSACNAACSPVIGPRPHAKPKKSTG